MDIKVIQYWTYRANGRDVGATLHLNMGKGVPAKRNDHSSKALVGDSVAKCQTEGA